MGILKKILEDLPIDYQQGYADGFDAGIKFYKDSLDELHKFMMKSAKIEVAKKGGEKHVSRS